MNCTLELKERLLKQLEAEAGVSTQPLLYLKFCACDTYAQDIMAGNLYANTATYFRELENAAGRKGQGDAFETISLIEAQKIVIYNEDGSALLTAPKGNIKTKYGIDDKIPIVSFVGIALQDMNLLKTDGDCAIFTLPFSAKEYKTMGETFGEYCVILDAQELEDKVKCYCADIGVGTDYIFDKIRYCPQNTEERVRAFDEGSKDRYLYKNEEFEYQRESRLVIPIEIPSDHFIRVGVIEKAKGLKSEELQFWNCKMKCD